MFEFMWLVPPHHRVLNFAKLCETKEYFNNIYDLSLESIDPAVLIEKMVTNVD